MQKTYYVYIMASHTKVLYTGVTNNMEARSSQHRNPTSPSFTERSYVNRLVWYEDYPDIKAAIAREKQIKGWSRAKKVRLIEEQNPRWYDLSFQWRKGQPAESSGDSSLRSE